MSSDSLNPLAYNLSVIDLEKDSDEEIIDQLMKQIYTIGFQLLKNINDYDEKKHLEAIKAFHNIDPSLKKLMFKKSGNPENINIFRGYTPFLPNDKSHKEFYDEGLSQDQIDPLEAEYPLYEDQPFNINREEFKDLKWIREEFDHVNKVWTEMGLKLISFIAIGLGKNSNYFDDYFSGGNLVTYRNIHYQPRTFNEVDSIKLDKDSLKLTTPEHSDSGFLTILNTFGYPGLQAQIEGKYRSIEPIENTLVINQGDTFAKMTNYKVKATSHRVLDIGKERYSAPMFLDPKYSAKVFNNQNVQETERLTVNDKSFIDENSADYYLYGDYLIKRMMESYVEWKDFVVPKDRRCSVKSVKDEDIRV